MVNMTNGVISVNKTTQRVVMDCLGTYVKNTQLSSSFVWSLAVIINKVERGLYKV